MERKSPFYIENFSLNNLMEPNGLSSYYHHHHSHQQQPLPPTAATHQSSSAASDPPPLQAVPPPNGVQPSASDRGSLPVFPHPGSAGAGGGAGSGNSGGGGGVSGPPLEPARKKRGRPRKYAPSEQGGSRAATSPSSSAHPPPSSSHKKRDHAFGGNAGQAFTPHIIEVSAGEDVAQKIMLFVQQCKRELCILSASGSISNASLRQPATSGGNITVEGRFEILSLSGSYVRAEHGGRSGGLSVCLANTDGQIFGGGIGGPLKAAGPVQVIVGTFLIDTKKDAGTGFMVDESSTRLPSPVGGASYSVGFQSGLDSSGRLSVRGGDDHQNAGGNQYMVHSRGVQMTHSRPTVWRGGLDGRTGGEFELAGTGHGPQESPENGNYEQIPD